MRSTLVVAVMILFLTAGGCRRASTPIPPTPPTPAPTNHDGAVESLYRHLNVQRWSYRLSAYRVGATTMAQIVHAAGAREDVLCALQLGSNVTEDGRLEVMIQSLDDGRLRTSMAFIGGGVTISCRTVSEAPLMRSASSQGFGFSEQEWPERIVLMQPPSNDEAKDKEEIFFRLVD